MCGVGERGETRLNAGREDEEEWKVVTLTWRAVEVVGASDSEEESTWVVRLRCGLWVFASEGERAMRIFCVLVSVSDAEVGESRCVILFSFLFSSFFMVPAAGVMTSGSEELPASGPLLE